MNIMKRKGRKILAAVMIAGALLVGAGTVSQPVVTSAASVRKVSGKKSKRYLKRPGFDWDNHYLEAGKKEDLTAYVKGTAGLSRKNRAKLIRWKSFNTSILRINRYGIAKAKKAGKARIRCRMKTKKGWKTVVKTIRVFDSRTVSFTVSLSLNRGNSSAGKVRTSYNEVFDMVSIRVKNSSKKPVTLQKDLLVCGPECSFVQAKDRYGTDVWMHCDNASSLVIPAGKTQTVVYRTQGALSYLKELQNKDNTCLVCGFSSEGTKREFRYELPSGKLTITR